MENMSTVKSRSVWTEQQQQDILHTALKTPCISGFWQFRLTNAVPPSRQDSLSISFIIISSPYIENELFSNCVGMGRWGVFGCWSIAAHAEILAILAYTLSLLGSMVCVWGRGVMSYAASVTSVIDQKQSKWSSRNRATMPCRHECFIWKALP